MMPHLHKRLAGGVLAAALVSSALLLTWQSAAADTVVALRIEGSTTTLFDDEVSVGDCVIRDTAGVDHNFSNVAACAVMAASAEQGFTTEWQDFGFGLFLKRIGDDDTPADFSQSWGFFVNYDPASVGTDSYTVSAGDDLLLAFSAYPGIPLRVRAPDSSVANEPTVVTVEKRVGEYDGSFVWHGRWEPVAGASVTADDAEGTTGEAGTVELTLPAGTVQTQATGTGYIRSNVLTLTVLSPTPTPTPTPGASPTPTPSPVVSPVASPTPTPTLTPSPEASPTPSPTPSVSPTPSPSPTGQVAGITTSQRQQAAQRALQYLRNKQDNGGFIDGSVVSGWAAIAFGAHDERAGSIRAGGASLADALAATTLQSATDFERHILALRAAGFDPLSYRGKNYVAELLRFHREGQIGEASLVNDDIFGVLALLAGGQAANGAVIRDAVTTILEKQSANGAWVGVDLTAAAIQALREYDRRGGSRNVDEALAAARRYLVLNQDERGGFSANSASTAWGIQAIIAMGENPDSWRLSNGETPWNALLQYQQSDGGFGWKIGDASSPFMTAYAATALLGEAWPVDSLATEATSTGGSEVTATLTPTSIAAKATTAARVAGVTAVVAPGGSKEAENIGQEAADVSFTSAADSAELSPAPDHTATLIPSSQPVPGAIPVNEQDWRFAFSLFGLANVGLGATLARLLAKLHFL